MDLGRYHRQMLLPQWGEEGQRKIAAAHVLLIGCGALGCSIADMMVRAGIGSITIVDRDVVELTNLQRQTLFTENDASAGLPKAEAARRRLADINSAVRVNAVVADFASRNGMQLSDGASIILDGTDNFETRYLINDLAVKRGIPYVYGGAVAMQGMAMSVVPGKTPCLRCLFEEPPPPGTAATCDTAGVFGPIISIIAALEAADALRLLLGHDGIGNALVDVELAESRFRRTDVFRGRRDDCPCCARGRFEFLEGQHERNAEYLCGQDAVQLAAPQDAARVDLSLIKSRLDPHGEFVVVSSLLIRGTLRSESGENGEPILLTVFADGRAIVKGTREPAHARSIYSRYVGA